MVKQPKRMGMGNSSFYKIWTKIECKKSIFNLFLVHKELLLMPDLGIGQPASSGPSARRPSVPPPPFSSADGGAGVSRTPHVRRLPVLLPLLLSSPPSVAANVVLCPPPIPLGVE